MENLGLWQFYWQSLLKALEFPNNLLGIIAIIFLAIKIVPTKHIDRWKETSMSKVYERVKGVSLYIFVILIVLSLIYAPYGMYRDSQQEANTRITNLTNQINKLNSDLIVATDQYRPILTLDPAFTLNPMIDETHSTANVTIKIKVNNIGERPAYQISAVLYAAPLGNPQQAQKYDNIYNNNPVYKGTQNNIVIDHVGYFTKTGNMGTIIFYIYIKWNNSPVGETGKWYHDPYWFLFNIDLQSKTVTLNPPTPELISYFEPYIKDLSK